MKYSTAYGELPIANYLVEEYLNDLQIYTFYKVKKRVTNSCT